MPKAKTNIFSFLTTISAVLFVYLLLRSGQYIYTLIYASESTLLIVVRTLVLLSYFVLSYLTYKRNVIAAWVMVILLLLSGVTTFSIGILTVPIAQYMIKYLYIIMGAYFLYGGIILLKSIRKGEMKGIDLLMK